MYCLTCSRPMLLLFTSAVCDHCNPPKKSLDLTGVSEAGHKNAQQAYTYYVILDDDCVPSCVNQAESVYLDVFDDMSEAVEERDLSESLGDESVYELHCSHEIPKEHMFSQGGSFHASYAFTKNYKTHPAHMGHEIHVVSLGKKVA